LLALCHVERLQQNQTKYTLSKLKTKDKKKLGISIALIHLSSVIETGILQINRGAPPLLTAVPIIQLIVQVAAVS
jgi:hypothetical protein